MKKYEATVIFPGFHDCRKPELLVIKTYDENLFRAAMTLGVRSVFSISMICS